MIAVSIYHSCSYQCVTSKRHKVKHSRPNTMSILLSLRWCKDAQLESWNVELVPVTLNYKVFILFLCSQPLSAVELFISTAAVHVRLSTWPHLRADVRPVLIPTVLYDLSNTFRGCLHTTSLRMLTDIQSMHLSVWEAWLTPLVAAEGKFCIGEEDLEVKHQAGNQDTPLSHIHCLSFDVWVWDMGHHKVSALSSYMNMLERRIWKSSIRLETKIRLCQTYIVPVLMYLHSHLDAFDTWAVHKILRILYTRHVSQMQKSEAPLVVRVFLTWWLIDVCGFSAILLALHLARIITELSQQVPDKYRPTGSDQ